MLETTRTYVARITNHEQVRDDLDQCGFSASKLWNVGRYYIQERWDDDGEIPEEADLKSALKDHERYSDLHSQSSQRVLEELAEAFTGWYNSADGNNPPGYRKRGDRHPRSTVTWKKRAIKHDDKHGQLRLSKGFNLKESLSDFILAEYETRPDVEVETIQQVRGVWNGDEWELHLVCKKEIPVEDAPGDNTAGIDLGIIDILPALKREDSFVGRRAVQRYPEGNFSSRWRVPGSCATRRPSKRGYGVFGVRGGRGIRLCRTRYRLNRGVRIPGNHPRLERGRTRVVPSTVLRRRMRSATANGACFGMLSPPRLRGRCRPSPVTGRGTVRTANESEPRTPHRVCRWWAWNRPYQREATPCLPIESLQR